ncbi:hypothetical protein OSTOST_01155 [Ostertagia ostertagi]
MPGFGCFLHQACQHLHFSLLLRKQSKFQMDGFRSTTIANAYVYGEVLTHLAHPSCMKAFLSGTDGAVTLTQREVDALLRLRWAFFPSYSDCASLEQMESRAAEASHIVAAILSGSNAVVDKLSDLRGHEALALLEKVKQSHFFSAGSWPLGGDDSSIGVGAALPPIPESPSEGEAPESSFNSTAEGNNGSSPMNENPSTKTSAPESITLEALKDVLNSAVSEETVGEEFSNSSPVSAPTTESRDDHNDSGNMSDSGNGTVSPDCEVIPDAKTEFKKKSNTMVREKRKFRGYARYSEAGATQEKERTDQRSYSTNRIQNGGSVASFQNKQGNFQKKRTNRFGLNYNTGIQEGSPHSEYWRSNGRSNYSRPDRFTNQSPTPFTYEPGISRRPGPTTLGFIFAGK